jgi:hypothetical protein
MLRTRSSLLVALSLALCCALALGCSDDDTDKKDTGTTKLDGGGKLDTGGAACTVTDLLPADDAVGDFKKGTPETAKDSKSLTDLINGGADKYFKNSFNCMTKVSYTSATQAWDLEVWLFDQGDTAGATGAYTDTAIPGVDADITPTIGEASRENINTVAGVYTGYARKDKYLVRIFAENTADATAGKDDVQAMLKAVVGAIK